MRGLANQAREMVLVGKPVTVCIAPGLSVAARAFVDEDTGLVNLELMASTPLGPVGGKLYTDVATFERMVEEAEKNEILPRAQAAIERATGQRLLLKR